MSTPPRLKVVNLWAGPGAGKSTTAAELFAKMKHAGYRVELVTEEAKDLTYDGDTRRLENQLLLLGRQYDRLDRIAGQVEWAITDSPLPLVVAYLNPRWRTPSFVALASEAFGHFDNHDFVIRRVKTYQPYGRRESEDEARELDHRISVVARDFVGPGIREVTGDATAADTILRQLKGAV